MPGEGEGLGGLEGQPCLVKERDFGDWRGSHAW